MNAARATARRRWALALAMLATPTFALAAEDVPATAPVVSADAATATAPATPTTPAEASVACHCAAAGTPVVLEIEESLVSDERKPGDAFALKLAEPIVVDGQVVVPAGTPGRGEIVHAAKARGGGRPGELLLAARYLEFGDRRIALRGMKLGAAGTDHTNAALATAIAIGPLAHFIHGSEMVVPPGTRAPAKLAEAVAATPAAGGSIAPDGLAAPAAESTAPPSTQE